MTTSSSPLTVALVGNPNTGKSTFFSALCGVPARIGNYPGVTVEKKLGSYRDSLGTVTVVDLPGTYSLSARTLDEKVSVDVLLGQLTDAPPVDIIINIIDATNLERNLYLFTQLRQLGLPILVVLNMWDRALHEIDLDLTAFQQRLGVPVITATASRGDGIDATKLALRDMERCQTAEPPQFLPAEFCIETENLHRYLVEHGQSISLFQTERLILDSGSVHAEQLSSKPELQEFSGLLKNCRDSLTQKGMRVPAVETKARYQWIRSILSDVYARNERSNQTVSDKIDHWLTHRYWGMAFFGLVMFVIYQAITQGAGWLAAIISEQLQPWLVWRVESWVPPGALRSLLADGVIAGVGAVIVFLPVILLLFFFVALMEDCGYMARAAFVMDKLMTKLGLSGKSFLPLMSSFACAVPGIMATRVIDSWRDRMVTILIAPLMSCSARLPVYMLFIAAFVPQKSWLGGWIGLQGLVLLAISLLGLSVAVPVAWLLKKWIFKGQPSAFVMELPSYKLPSLRVVFFRVWESGQAFLTRAGTLIFCTSILVWAAGYFPADHALLDELTAQLESLPADADDQQAEHLQARRKQLSGELMEQSLLGRVGHWIEPAVRPLGWDWRIGVGVVASFPAREVIIATLGTIYALGGEVDERDEGLLTALHQAKWPDGRPVYNLPVALSIMVFFALCAQCAATLMVIRRETNSWRWPLFAFTYMTTLAYLGALAVYQLTSQFFQ